MFGPAGISGGCPPKIDGDFEPADLDAAVEHIKTQLGDTYNNSGQQFFCVLFLMFSGEAYCKLKDSKSDWFISSNYANGDVVSSRNANYGQGAQ